MVDTQANQYAVDLNFYAEECPLFLHGGGGGGGGEGRIELLMGR
jgi:hypothetical protein